MKRVVFTGPVIQVLAAFGMIAGIGLIIYLMSGMPRPRERHRVSTPAGEFSIIKPHDWTATTAYSPADGNYIVSIICEATRAIGVGPRLIVAHLRTPPDINKLAASGAQRIEFQGKEAFASTKTLKRDFFWNAVFERDGHWYEIILRLDAPEDVPNSGWWSYLNSFRPGAPATQPATQSAN